MDDAVTFSSSQNSMLSKIYNSFLSCIEWCACVHFWFRRSVSRSIGRCEKTGGTKYHQKPRQPRSSLKLESLIVVVEVVVVLRDGTCVALLTVIDVRVCVCVVCQCRGAISCDMCVCVCIIRLN